MVNPDTAPVSTFMPSFETAARSLKVEPIIAPVHSDVEIETAPLVDAGQRSCPEMLDQSPEVRTRNREATPLPFGSEEPG